MPTLILMRAAGFGAFASFNERANARIDHTVRELVMERHIPSAIIHDSKEAVERTAQRVAAGFHYECGEEVPLSSQEAPNGSHDVIMMIGAVDFVESFSEGALQHSLRPYVEIAEAVVFEVPGEGPWI